ncbi:DNA transposition AAA+ family ATPase [Rhizobium petrolearium]|uniref:AAA family ATPase n=1 Tax=Neorhizobium petrolearium TaxID=515361 RepID=UPI001AE43D55|nr:AAA family ATPase [Neorhizobium petrolearium]MBP1844786.1 DNA transposition AAA+ family ATPase [Neorhizobium petrolearium]
MNKHVDTRPYSGWERPEPDEAFVRKHNPDDLDEWRQLREQTAEIAIANAWTKAEVTRRSSMKDGTFSQWFSGSYPGVLANVNRQVRVWIDAVLEAAAMPALPSSPSFVRTRIAVEIGQTLQWAQMTADLVIITVAAGNGKTIACRHYKATHPHVYHATISPHTRTVHGMLVELAAELDVFEANPARLTRAIGNKLARSGGGTLLVVDEAQNLVDDAINQLRHFSDIYQCGIALVGNEEVYSRFVAQVKGRSYAQLKRRVGKHLKRQKPYAEDIAAFIAAWGVTEADSVRLLTGIGMKGGALGQIDKTMKLASMIAIGEEREVTVKDIEAAWKNRDVEDIA